MGALGESRWGAGQDADNLIYLTVSTGVGGGIILNRQVYRGARGFAGELGHVPAFPITPASPLCKPKRLPWMVERKVSPVPTT